MFRLAHISDLHIGPLPPVTLRQLASKRGLGYLAWRLRKQRSHRTEVLEALRRDLQSKAPDHVVITGDLVNLALEAEFVQAGAWLRLTDGAKLRQVVARRGAELILHGHEHAPRIRELEGPNAPIPVRGAPSASKLDARPERRAQYQIYRIEAAADGWRLQSEARGFDPALANFASVASGGPDQLTVGAGRMSAGLPPASP